VGAEELGPMLTRRLALKGLGGLGAAALGVTGCAARDPAGHALTTAATPRAARPPGTLLWHVRAPGGIISLVVADGLLCAGVDQSDVSSGVFGAYAMHVGTGRTAWTRYGDAAVTPFAAEAGVLFGDGPAGLAALSASGGKALWTADAGTVNPGSASTWVLVTGGTVCTTSQIGSSVQEARMVVIGLDSGTGQRKWAADFPSAPTGLTGAGGQVFAGSPTPPYKGSGKVAALDPATGQRRWTSADLRLTPGEIAATDNVVAVSTSQLSSSPGSHRTLGLDTATGRELWRADGAAYPLTAGGGLVYGVTRTLWARDARTGRQVWERAFSQPPVSLAAAGDIVLAASSDTVQALSAAAGNQLWSHTIPVHPIAITTADDVVYLAASSNPAAEDSADEVYAFQA